MFPIFKSKYSFLRKKNSDSTQKFTLIALPVAGSVELNTLAVADAERLVAAAAGPSAAD